MNAPHAASLTAALLLALLTGCETGRATRIREHAAVYESLDPFSRKLIHEGQFDLGFPTEAIYMALGKPNRATVTETPDGPLETWTYKNFIYGNFHRVIPSQRSTSTVPRSSRASVSSGPIGTAVPTRTPQPVTPEIADPPMATLILEIRDGKLLSARLE